MIDHFAIWRSLVLILTDCETTGWSPWNGDRIVELAAVRIEGMKITASWQTYLNPERPIPPEASAVHLLYDEDVALAPRFVEKAESFVDFCADAVPCAYKESFDRQFVTAEFDRTKMRPKIPLYEWQTWLDPLAFVRSIDRFLPNEKGDNSLLNACKRRGIEVAGAHGALADATAAAELLIAIAHEMPTCTVSELLRRQGAVNDAWHKRWDAAKASGRVA